MGLPGVNVDGSPKTKQQILRGIQDLKPLLGASGAAQSVRDLFSIKSPSGPDFPSLVAEFVKDLAIPEPPEPTAAGIAPPPGLREAQLQAQTLGTLQLSGGPVNPLQLPNF